MITRVGRPRQIACQLGHGFTPANVRYTAAGAQKCVACGRQHSRQYRTRQQARRENKRTIALIVWRQESPRTEFRASWTYHRTHAAAAAFAPRDNTPFCIVDVARKLWIHHPSITEVLQAR
jgi:hypothetical protein